jgi:purine-binding chemotaxis protein CheW
VRALRDAFDGSFAAAVAAEPPAQLDFLTIRVAGDPYALRLSEVQSLHAERKLVAAPSLLPGLLGVAGFRGVLTPVYDLSSLLGYAQPGAAKWLVVAQHAEPIGFAFEVFDAHLRIDSAQVSGTEAEGEGALRGAVQTGGRAVPLLHLPALIEAILRRIKAFEPSQER